jgi:DNA repair exonuclease SbcCD ATPase subunit
MNIIKKNVIAALMIPALSACNQDKIDQISSENEKLATRTTELNTEVEKYLKTFNEIEANLREIKAREDKLNLTAKEGVEYQDGDNAVAMVEDIKAINALMAENKEKMAELQASLDQSGSEYKKMVNNLNYRIKQIDTEITQLKTNLDSLNVENTQLAQNIETLTKTVDTLSFQKEENMATIEEQQSTIAEQTTSLNTAYVAIGTGKALADEEVVVKEGGFLGIGSSEKLNKKLNENAFSRIDITEVKSIPVSAKKVELITTHPEGSYQCLFDIIISCMGTCKFNSCISLLQVLFGEITQVIDIDLQYDLMTFLQRNFFYSFSHFPIT